MVIEEEQSGPRFSRLVSIRPDDNAILQQAIQQQQQQPPRVRTIVQPVNAHPNGRMKFMSQVIGLHLKPRVEELLGATDEDEEIEEDEEEEEEGEEQVVREVISPGSAINEYLNKIGNKYR